MSPGKNETRRNRDDDHDGLRFENYEKIASFSFFFFFLDNSIALFFNIFVKKEKIRGF